MPKPAPEKTDDNDLSSIASQSILLAKKARSGSRTAFHQLVDIYQKAIFRMVYYRIRSQMDAEDLTQEIFLQAFKNLHRLKSAESFRSWLYRIALNRTRDFHRKKRFRSMFDAPSNDVDILECASASDDTPEVMKHLERQDFWRQTGKILDKLSRMEREVFLFRFFDNLSIKEMGDIMKKSESTIKTHLYRALNKLRRDPSILALLDYNLGFSTNRPLTR